MRSIQSSEKERTDLSGRSGCGHLVLVCTEHHRPRPLLQVNKLRRQHRWAWLSRIFLRCVGADLDLIKNAKHFTRIDLHRSRFEKECNQESLPDAEVSVRQRCILFTRYWRLKLENRLFSISRSSKVIDLGANRKRTSDFLCVISGNFGCISYRFRDIEA